ncbi:hypothetical protein CBR_g157 [Chara braunii]|uniref:Uncharacterized protein n=1 Tax=Chara braunii TaxID=69332 RepID=A0A388JLS7_CHABU|nr:hypothetical protein CBR_g157 [Chara braunii]|eukprot:GBG58757.1 hypothetical protein CBR_g157 [Chara braunii]
MEVNTLRELRLKDAGGRIEAEKEVERLKEAMARLDMEKRKNCTNLKSRLDEAAGPSAHKPPCSSSKKKGNSTPGIEMNDREAFVQQERKNLRKKNKEEIQRICREEDVAYTTLEPTKEEIIYRRVQWMFGIDGPDKEKGKEDSVVEVMAGATEEHEMEDGDDSAAS